MSEPLCTHCGHTLCPREVLCNQALGFLAHYLCLECLSRERASSAKALYDYLRDYILERPCFAEAWQEITLCPPLDRPCAYCQ
jgi:hypothetical protein